MYAVLLFSLLIIACQLEQCRPGPRLQADDQAGPTRTSNLFSMEADLNVRSRAAFDTGKREWRRERG